MIQESRIKFVKAVAETIRSVCVLESEPKFDAFIRCYKRKGMARLDLETSIWLGDEEAVHFQGRYVVFK